MGCSHIPALNQLTLTQDQFDTMQAHVESCAPNEACGLLAGREGKVNKVFLITNKEHSPEKYKMEPIEQLQAFDEMEMNGLDLVGIFHSHPNGPEALSETDVDEAGYPVVQIIWSPSRLHPEAARKRWQARGFWIDNGQALEVKLHIINGE